MPLEEPFRRLEVLLVRAGEAGLKEPTAALLATSDGAGRPAARTVLVKSRDVHGLVFYSHRDSRKGRELSRNPRAALCFYWDPLEEQALVEGSVHLVSPEEANAYWASRPRKSQLGGWASRQSQPLRSRAVLLGRVIRAAARFAAGPVPRPPSWVGYRVVPDRWEFLTLKAYRLHQRLLYLRQGGGWTKSLLFP